MRPSQRAGHVRSRPTRPHSPPPASHSELFHTRFSSLPLISWFSSISSPLRSLPTSLCFLSYSPALVLEMFKSPAQLFPSRLVPPLGRGRGRNTLGGLGTRLPDLVYLMIQIPERHKLPQPASADAGCRPPCSHLLSCPTWVSHTGLLGDPSLIPGSYSHKAEQTPPCHPLSPFPFDFSYLLSLVKLVTSKLVNFAGPQRGVTIH